MEIAVIAPGEERSPALALVNSLHNTATGTVDRIGRPADAVAWLVKHGLLPAGTTVPEGRLTGLYDLRDAVRAVFVARITEAVPSEETLVILNRASAAAPIAPELAWTVPDEPASSVHEIGGDALTRALAVVARDAIDAVCGERGAALLACEAPGCMRLLARDHGRRRWCSTACGDRVRAARYYARHRPDPAH